MTNKLKEEAAEQIYKDVRFGFDTLEEILEGIVEMLYNEEIDKNWIEQEIKEQSDLLIKESQNWKKPNDFTKLKEAFDELNSNGIIALNKAGYTKQDGYEDVGKVKEELKKHDVLPRGFCFYHTQDLERAILPEIGNLYLAFDSINEEDVEAIKIGKEIVRSLEQKGFSIVWEETVNTRILIEPISWQKLPDEEEWGMERAFALLMKA